MARPRKAENELKVRKDLRLDPHLLAWAESRVGPGKRFATLTHAVESGLARLREDEEGSPSRGSKATTPKKA